MGIVCSVLFVFIKIIVIIEWVVLYEEFIILIKIMFNERKLRRFIVIRLILINE